MVTVAQMNVLSVGMDAETDAFGDLPVPGGERPQRKRGSTLF